MKRQDARIMITSNPGQILDLDKQSQRGKLPPSYVCPICKSGTGKHGTGITSKDGRHFTCWTGCFSNADMIDIVGLQYGLTDFNSKFEKACELYGIDYNLLEPDDKAEAAARKPFSLQAKPKSGSAGAAENESQPAADTDQTDYRGQFAEWQKDIAKTDYLTRRGISESLQRYFNIGYCAEWQSPAALKKGKWWTPKTPRIIIPTSPYSYIARDTRPDTEMREAERDFKKMKEGRVHFFRTMSGKLSEQKAPFFIVEGEIDALSIAEVGQNAVALGSTSQAKAFIEIAKKDTPSQPVIIATDNDDAGRKAADILFTGILDAGGKAYRANIAGAFKDPNEYLVADRDAFTAAVYDEFSAAKLRAVDKETASRAEYIRENCVAGYLPTFIENITSDTGGTPYTPTGFSNLDKVLDGGLYEGLHIVGAVSSNGKTTLALQIADRVAQGGRDVIIFSLEMSRDILIARSISRLTAEIATEAGQPLKDIAATSRDITVTQRHKYFTPSKRENIRKAIEAYKEYAGHVYIVEGMGDVSAERIRETIKQHMDAVKGEPPVCIVDYLQLVAAPDPHLTDKQVIDRAVLELRRICRDEHLPIIAISSFNRAAYSNAADMASFKESGAVEYSADVLLALDLEGVGQDGYNEATAKKGDATGTRHINLTILKNREAPTGDAVKFRYLPAYNLFMDEGLTTAKQAAAQRQKQKKNRRETARENLELAFNFCADPETQEAALSDLCDFLNVRAATVKSYIREFGGYTIAPITNTVSRQEFREPTPLDRVPFEDPQK